MQKLSTEKHFTLDDSLSLINRTGAFYIARELVEAFSGVSKVRRWRLWGDSLKFDLLRKVYARLMLKELNFMQDSEKWLWPEDKSSAFTLYLDPLYVLRNKLKRNDVVLCHDIGPISHPHLYFPETVALYKKAYIKIRASRCGMVFVSEFSKSAFVDAFGSDFRFLQSIPLYLRSNLAEVTAKPLESLNTPFFLSVGALEDRKNHAKTIEAFENGRFFERGFQLIICGSRGDSADKVKKLVSETPGVRLLGYVSDGELSWLYQHAQLFVLPSQFEGFGMPALEAAAFGLPLVISKKNALNEAVNNLGEEVGHTSSVDIARGIEAILSLNTVQKLAMSERLQACAKDSSQEKFINLWSKLINEQCFFQENTLNSKQ